MTEIRDHYVYRIFDIEGRLLYVGCTKNFERRWREQKVDRPTMVAAAARCKLSGPHTYTTARRLEAEAIETEEPLHNFTLARRRERIEQGRRFDRRLAKLVERGMELNEALDQMRAEGLFGRALA